MSLKSDGVTINSKNDSCFSVTYGSVIANFDFGGEFALLIKGEDNLYYVYASFKSIAIRKGDSVKRGQFLGLLLPTDFEKGSNDLIFIMSDNDGRFLSYADHLNFLKIFSTDCTLPAATAL